MILKISLHSQSGYIAITSATIMLLIILLIVSTLGMSSSFSRTDISLFHFKEQSQALAEGCVEVALLRLAENKNYGGGENVTIGSSICRIVSVVANGSEKIVRAEAEFQETNTNLVVTVSGATLDILSWEEVPSL